MTNITKYLLDYNPKNNEKTKKRNQSDKNTEDNEEDIEINSEEELNNNNKKKIKKNKYSHLDKDNLKWNSAWILKYPWLYYKKKNGREVLFYKICKDVGSNNVWVTISSEWLKEDCIEQHEKSKKYEKVLNTKDSNQLSIKEGFMHQMGSSQALIISCMHNIYYLTQYNIVFNNYESL